MTIRSVVGVAAALCAFYAVTALPLSQFYAFIFASPLIITILAIPMLGEVVRLRRGLAIVVGLIGVLIVIRPGLQNFQRAISRRSRRPVQVHLYPSSPARSARTNAEL